MLPLLSSSLNHYRWCSHQDCLLQTYPFRPRLIRSCEICQRI